MEGNELLGSPGAFSHQATPRVQNGDRRGDFNRFGCTAEPWLAQLVIGCYFIYLFLIFLRWLGLLGGPHYQATH